MRTLLLFLASLPALAQNAGYPILTGTTLPPTCPINSLFFKTAPPGGLYFCVSPDTWTATAFVAPGQITLILSGSCPFGFSEVTALDGKTIIGTLSAHGDVGTTGGSDTITPQGSVSAPVFAGASTPTSSVSAGTPSGLVAAIQPTGTAPLKTGAAGPQNVADNLHAHPAPLFTGTLMAAHSHTVTATGSNSAPGFTGTPFDNRSAFIKAIFCSKD